MEVIELRLGNCISIIDGKVGKYVFGIVTSIRKTGVDVKSIIDDKTYSVGFDRVHPLMITKRWLRDNDFNEQKNSESDELIYVHNNLPILYSHNNRKLFVFGRLFPIKCRYIHHFQNCLIDCGIELDVDFKESHCSQVDSSSIVNYVSGLKRTSEFFDTNAIFGLSSGLPKVEVAEVKTVVSSRSRKKAPLGQNNELDPDFKYKFLSRRPFFESLNVVPEASVEMMGIIEFLRGASNIGIDKMTSRYLIVNIDNNNNSNSPLYVLKNVINRRDSSIIVSPQMIISMLEYCEKYLSKPYRIGLGIKEKVLKELKAYVNPEKHSLLDKAAANYFLSELLDKSCDTGGGFSKFRSQVKVYFRDGIYEMAEINIGEYSSVVYVNYETLSELVGAYGYFLKFDILGDGNNDPNPLMSAGVNKVAKSYYTVRMASPDSNVVEEEESHEEEEISDADPNVVEEEELPEEDMFSADSNVVDDEGSHEEEEMPDSNVMNEEELRN